MSEKELSERITIVEQEQKYIIKKLDELNSHFSKLNDNLSTFTQELTLIKADSHNSAVCRSTIVKEAKTEIVDSFKTVGKITAAIGVIIAVIIQTLSWRQ